jgi:hypothetical protein
MNDFSKDDVDRIESLAGSSVELSGKDDNFRVEVELRTQ